MKIDGLTRTGHRLQIYSDGSLSLLPGYKTYVIRIGSRGQGTLQAAYESTKEDRVAPSGEIAGGCCSTMCILYAVLVWRFAATTLHSQAAVQANCLRR